MDKSGPFLRINNSLLVSLYEKVKGNCKSAYLFLNSDFKKRGNNMSENNPERAYTAAFKLFCEQSLIHKHLIANEDFHWNGKPATVFVADKETADMIKNIIDNGVRKLEVKETCEVIDVDA